MNNNPFYPTVGRPAAPSYPETNPYLQAYVNGGGYSTPGAGSSSGHHAPVPANAYEYDVGMLAQQSVYVPGAMIDKRGGAGGKVAKGGKRTTVLRKGAGKVWEDQTLLEWDPSESDKRSVRMHELTCNYCRLVQAIRGRLEQRCL